MIYINAIIGLLTGMGIFLLGMHLMGDGLEKMASNKMRQIFSKISNNRFVGLGVGTGVTAIIHSSSATTVMVIGFVNAGLMTLLQATNIIMGANIGTTITGLITAMGTLNMDLYLMTPVFIGVVMMLFGKKESVKKIGIILAGTGLIFVGLNIMSDSVGGLKNDAGFQKIFTIVDNPLLLMMIGMIITAIVQSSTAVNGLIIILAVPFGARDGLDIVDALFIILGTNVGTCFTALFSSVGTNTNAKRASIFHLLFNVIGTVLFAGVFILIPKASIADMMTNLFGSNAQFQIAWFNFFQNLICALVMLPFGRQLVRLTEIIIKDKPDKLTEYNFKFIDNRFLSTPSIAVGQVIKEIVNVGELTEKNLSLAMKDFLSKSLENKGEIKENQIEIIHFTTGITNYLIRLSSDNLNDKDKSVVASLFAVVSNINRLNDYAESIFNYNSRMLSESLILSNEAYDELEKMYEMIDKMYELVFTAFEERDISKLREVHILNGKINDYKDLINNNHITRLNDSKCTVENGMLFYGTVSILERTSFHLLTIIDTLKVSRKKVKQNNIEINIISHS